MSKSHIGNLTRASDQHKLIRILHLPQRIEVQRRIERDLTEQLPQLDDMIIDKGTALKAKSNCARICRKLRSLPIQPVPLLDNFIEGCLYRSLLRIAAVRYEQETLVRHEERGRVSAKAAEILDVLLLRNEHRIHNLLRKQCAQTRNTRFHVHRMSPIRQIMISSAAR